MLWHIKHSTSMLIDCAPNFNPLFPVPPLAPRFHTMCSWFSLSQSLCPLTTWKCVPQWICLMVCYGRDEMACHLHPILCNWDAVTTCTPVTVFFPLGVRLWKKIHGKKSGIQLGFKFKTFWILNIIIHERFLLLSVNNIKPLNFHHQPWSWLLGLLGGLATYHD